MLLVVKLLAPAFFCVYGAMYSIKQALFCKRIQLLRPSHYKNFHKKWSTKEIVVKIEFHI